MWDIDLAMQFPDASKDAAAVFLEDTDRDLPKRIDVRTRYAFFKTIARGGKSIIQSCKDLHLSRVICYKGLRPEMLENDIEQKRFLREARVTAMLQHPATVPVYELGRDSRGNMYFTMKLVHGYTLRELLHEEYRDRYDLVQLMDVVVQIAHALDYAHSNGVVHRDIKPENILVGPFGEVLLLDWGLAKVWDKEGVPHEPPEGAATPHGEVTITHQGKLEGTPAYMSPEQIERDPDIDGRTDIFSLGTIVYEILAGQRPNHGETVHAVIQSTLNDTPEKPSVVATRQVPKRLEEITMRCIEKDPKERIGSAADLVRELQQQWM